MVQVDEVEFLFHFVDDHDDVQHISVDMQIVHEQFDVILILTHGRGAQLVHCGGANDVEFVVLYKE